MRTVKTYKCLNCKAGLEFDPASQKWKCHYCFSEFTRQSLDLDSENEPSEDHDGPELDAYHCNNCGAELITDRTISATSCLYCRSSAVIRSRFAGRFKPRYLVPFKLTKAQAEEIYNKWMKKRLFVPTAFKTKEESQKITGIYAPFWLFDCMAEGHLEGEGTRTNHWRQGDYNYTRTRYYRVFRKGNVQYKKIPVDASKKLDDALMHKIEPYHYGDLTDFSLQYMSGFMAERFDVEVPEAERVMQGRVAQYTENRLQKTISGYQSFRATDKKTNLSDITHSYAMMPVYLLIHKHKDKEYIFIVNGQTGKVVGNTPVSPFKQLRFAGCVFGIVWFIAVFGGAIFG